MLRNVSNSVYVSKEAEDISGDDHTVVSYDTMLVCVTHAPKQGFTWPSVRRDGLLSLLKCVHMQLQREKSLFHLTLATQRGTNAVKVKRCIGTTTGTTPGSWEKLYMLFMSIPTGNEHAAENSWQSVMNMYISTEVARDRLLCVHLKCLNTW